VRVRIFRDDRLWIKGAERYGFDPSCGGCCGSVDGIDVANGERTIKEVHVNLKAEHIGAGYVAHEMVHAGMVLRRSLKKRDEETLAYIIGDIVAKFWDKMYKLEERLSK